MIPLLVLTVLSVTGCQALFPFSIFQDQPAVVRRFSPGYETPVAYFQTPEMNSGHSIACDTSETSLSKINITWKPEIIQLGKDIKLDFDIIPNMDINTFSVTAEFWNGKNWHTSPILKTTLNVPCDELKKYVKNLKCPIKKGVNIVWNEVLRPENLPSRGTYSTKLTLRDNDHEKRKFGCVVFVVSFSR